MNPIKINSFEISENSDCYIIAELSANHCQKLEIALDSVKSIKRTGANAIKLQTFRPESLTLNVDSDDFNANPNSPWKGRRLYDLYKETRLPYEWYDEIFELAQSLDLDCFSSPFDFEAVEILEAYNPPAYKIASFEITDIPLIECVAKLQKPVIISTGVAMEEDIQLAVDTCHNVGNENVILLKCTSQYPTPLHEVHLGQVPFLRERFNKFIGLSDHTLGWMVPFMSFGFGVKVVEKHFKLDDSIQSADSSFSLSETEFTEMVEKVRQAETIIGSSEFGNDERAQLRRQRRRSLYIADDVKRGDVLSALNVKSVRPGHGLHPKFYYDILGKVFTEDFKKGTPLDKSNFE